MPSSMQMQGTCRKELSSLFFHLEIPSVIMDVSSGYLLIVWGMWQDTRILSYQFLDKKLETLSHPKSCKSFHKHFQRHFIHMRQSQLILRVLLNGFYYAIIIVYFRSRRRKLMHLVASICLSVCVSCLTRYTFDFDIGTWVNLDLGYAESVGQGRRLKLYS